MKYTVNIQITYNWLGLRTDAICVIVLNIELNWNIVLILNSKYWKWMLYRFFWLG